METFLPMADRVAALEQEVGELRRQLLARDRLTRLTAPEAIRWVKTKAAGGTLTYPTWPARRLPVVFVDLVDAGDDTTSYPEHAAESQFRLASPIWIPEGVLLPVSWHARLYWPLYIPSFKGVVSESGGIDPGDTGSITVWLAGAATSQVLEARYDWFHESETLPEERQVDVRYQSDQGEYVIVDWSCT